MIDYEDLLAYRDNVRWRWRMIWRWLHARFSRKERERQQRVEDLASVIFDTAPIDVPFVAGHK